MNEAYRRKCYVCGTEFVTEFPSQVYCSLKCRRKAQNARARKASLRESIPYATEDYWNEYGEVPVKKISIKGKSIAEIAKEAQEADLSYGYYVAKHEQ